MNQRLTVKEHHGRSEIVSIVIDAKEKYYVIVEHLASQKCIVVDLVFPDEYRLRVRNIYYDD